MTLSTKLPYFHIILSLYVVTQIIILQHIISKLLFHVLYQIAVTITILFFKCVLIKKWTISPLFYPLTDKYRFKKNKKKTKTLLYNKIKIIHSGFYSSHFFTGFILTLSPYKVCLVSSQTQPSFRRRSFIIPRQVCHFSPLSKNTMEEVGRSERLLKNCRNNVNELGEAKNTAQRVNTIKDYRREDADKALLTFK